MKLAGKRSASTLDRCTGRSAKQQKVHKSFKDPQSPARTPLPRNLGQLLGINSLSSTPESRKRKAEDTSAPSAAYCTKRQRRAKDWRPDVEVYLAGKRPKFPIIRHTFTSGLLEEKAVEIKAS